jgi:hypothetical protein
MAQSLTPELYLSLLSGRCGSTSHVSTERRHNHIASRISGHPFPNDRDRLMDLLDALAAVCIHKDKAEVFFVSLAMDSEAVTLHVSSNTTAPATVTSHLTRIWGKLRMLQAVVEFDPPIPADSETSPDPNNTKSRTDNELELQMIIYEYSFSKLRRRFLKRAPAILAIYNETMTSLRANNTTEDTSLLRNTYYLLQHIHSLLQDEGPPHGQCLIDLIQTIDMMSQGWRNELKAVGGKDILTRWDNLIRASGLTFCIYGTTPQLLFLDADQNTILSLRWLLAKLFTLHHHIRTITRIAWSRRLSPFLTGQFNVVSVPAVHGDISIKFSQQNILPVIFPPGQRVERDVELSVYGELLKNLQTKADDEGIEMKKGSVPVLSMKVSVHAESTLLAYHLQHPQLKPYPYFGGSKLSCYGCSTLFSSFNLVAESFGLPQFFTRGCHNKIDLRWPCPPLLSYAQQMRLQPKDLSLNTQVRKGMIAVLSTELAAYVHELRVAAEGPSRPQSDSTAASCGSQESEAEGRARMKAKVEAGMCE